MGSYTQLLGSFEDPDFSPQDATHDGTHWWVVNHSGIYAYTSAGSQVNGPYLVGASGVAWSGSGFWVHASGVYEHWSSDFSGLIESFAAPTGYSAPIAFGNGGLWGRNGSIMGRFSGGSVVETLDLSALGTLGGFEWRSTEPWMVVQDYGDANPVKQLSGTSVADSYPAPGATYPSVPSFAPDFFLSGIAVNPAGDAIIVGDAEYGAWAVVGVMPLATAPTSFLRLNQNERRSPRVTQRGRIT